MEAEEKLLEEQAHIIEHYRTSAAYHQKEHDYWKNRALRLQEFIDEKLKD